MLKILEPIVNLDTERQYTSMVSRLTVKALCESGGKMVVLALDDGTYKLPGGGVELGENKIEALCRELKEECGLDVLSEIKPVFRLDEYKQDKFNPSCIFCNNFYFCCLNSKSRACIHA